MIKCIILPLMIAAIIMLGSGCTSMRHSRAVNTGQHSQSFEKEIMKTLRAKYPDRFAAIAPICGGDYPQDAEHIAHLPVWVFHGAQDKTVPLEKSQEMVTALEKAGGKVKFTVYPDAGHDSWTETYNNPELYDWFLKHKREGN